MRVVGGHQRRVPSNLTVCDMFKQDRENKCIKVTVSYSNVDAAFLNYGATLISLRTPDIFGDKKNIVLSFDTIKEYTESRHFIGASIGRTAGRIKSGRYKMDGTWYNVEKNEGDNHIHGGNQGFDNVYWQTEIFEEHGKTKVLFKHTFLERHEGYPGNLAMVICYTIYESGKLEIEYKGISDKKTIVNPTNHTYFNLSGNKKSPVIDHKIWLNSDAFFELDKDHTLKRVLPVENTIFDMNKLKNVGTIIYSDNAQIRQEKGLNHPALANLQNETQISSKKS